MSDRSIQDWLSDDELVWDDDFDFSEEAFDDVLRGRQVTILDGAQEVGVLRGDRRNGQGDGAERLKLILRAVGQPIAVTITSAVDNEEIVHEVTLHDGATQVVSFSAERLVVLADYIGSGGGTATLHWRLDYDNAAASTWHVTQAFTAPNPSVEVELVPPPFAQDFVIKWIEGEDAIRLRYYEGETGASNKYSEEALTLSSGTQRVNQRGPMTVDKSATGADEKYLVLWRCHG